MRLLHYHSECTFDGWEPRGAFGSKPTRFATVPRSTTLRPRVCRLQNSHINALVRSFVNDGAVLFTLHDLLRTNIIAHLATAPCSRSQPRPWAPSSNDACREFITSSLGGLVTLFLGNERTRLPRFVICQSSAVR